MIFVHEFDGDVMRLTAGDRLKVQGCTDVTQAVTI